MRLAAVYFPEGVLSHLFGKDHIGLTINFGGNYNYKIEINETLGVNRILKNEYFISDFWGKDISMISAVVGRNGIGKTSILRALHTAGDKRKKNVFYLFEGPEETCYYFNELENTVVTANFDIKEINSNALSSVKHYYTPVIDIEQINTLSQLSLISTGEENLSQLYLKQLKQDVILLNDPVKHILKEVYPDFPEYKELEIRITQHRKFDFKNVYATANLGSQDRVTVLKTYIESDLRDLEEGKLEGSIGEDYVRNHILKRYIDIINSSGLNSLFDRLWALDEYNQGVANDNVHGENDFLKNFEVTLFTYFILDATFPQTPFQGTFEIQSIFDQPDFEKRFDAFFDLYMTSIYGHVRDSIENKLERVSIADYDQIKIIVNDDQHKKWTAQGFESANAVELMLRYVERFKAFFDFYVLLRDIISKKEFEVERDTLVYKLEEHNENIFYDLIRSYEKVLSLADNFVYRLDILSIRSTYSLSSGEKSLLNFFARINNGINRMKNSSHPIFNYYLLLLDEPELGYHPIWKRKFVDAITKSVPILYSKLAPNRNLFDKDSPDFSDLKVQIIFTTHDPLTLSDIPQSNVVYLDRTEKGITFINKNRFKSFGANVHDLLADSFFLEDGFMGEFSESLIHDLIRFLTSADGDQRHSKLSIKWNEKIAQKFIEIVDEPLISERFQLLYDREFLKNDERAIRDRIKELKAQLKQLPDA